MNASEKFHILLGKNIVSAFINQDCNEVILTDSDFTMYNVSHAQNCCEDVYYAHINQVDFLIGGCITKVECLEYEDLSIEKDSPRNVATEEFVKFGIAIHTTKGTVTFETRMEGSGNYAGDIMVTQIALDKDNTFKVIDDGIELIHKGTKDYKEHWYRRQYYHLKDF